MVCIRTRARLGTRGRQLRHLLLTWHQHRHWSTMYSSLRTKLSALDTFHRKSLRLDFNKPSLRRYTSVFGRPQLDPGLGLFYTRVLFIVLPLWSFLRVVRSFSPLPLLSTLAPSLSTSSLPHPPAIAPHSHYASLCL